MSGELTGRVALVTGGSRGLGRAMSLAFARAGADVVVTSRKLDACVATVEEIRAATGRQGLAHACHVGRWSDHDGLVDAAYARFGRVDVLVNNAGISPRYDGLADVGEDLYDKVLDVNLKGPFRLTALVGTRMMADGGGSIINISSVAAVRPNPENLPYSAAKAGLNALTVGFARAFGPTVRVNCIMAGPFSTDVVAGWDPDYEERVRRGQMLQRIGRPEEITGAALHLAGDASSFTTGAVLTVDGGMV